MSVFQEPGITFTPEIDCEIIRGYAGGDPEPMFRLLEKKHGLSESAVAARAAVLGIDRRFIEQLELSEVSYAPRTCLRCDAVFVSRGPQNRFCPKCLHKNRAT